MDILKEAEKLPKDKVDKIRKNMNERMKKVHREYIIRARQSEIDASKVILTD